MGSWRMVADPELLNLLDTSDDDAGGEIPAEVDEGEYAEHLYDAVGTPAEPAADADSASAADGQAEPPPPPPRPAWRDAGYASRQEWRDVRRARDDGDEKAYAALVRARDEGTLSRTAAEVLAAVERQVAAERQRIDVERRAPVEQQQSMEYARLLTLSQDNEYALQAELREKPELGQFYYNAQAWVKVLGLPQEATLPQIRAGIARYQAEQEARQRPAATASTTSITDQMFDRYMSRPAVVALSDEQREALRDALDPDNWPGKPDTDVLDAMLAVYEQHVTVGRGRRPLGPREQAALEQAQRTASAVKNGVRNGVPVGTGGTAGARTEQQIIAAFTANPGDPKARSEYAALRKRWGWG